MPWSLAIASISMPGTVRNAPLLPVYIPRQYTHTQALHGAESFAILASQKVVLMIKTVIIRIRTVTISICLTLSKPCKVK